MKRAREEIAVKRELRRRGLSCVGYDALLHFRLAQHRANKPALKVNKFKPPQEPPPQLVFEYSTHYDDMEGVLSLPLDVLATLFEYTVRELGALRLVCKQFFEAVRRAWVRIGTRIHGPHGWTFKTWVLCNTRTSNRAYQPNIYGEKATVEAFIKHHNYVDYDDAYREFRVNQRMARTAEGAFLRTSRVGYADSVLKELIDVHGVHTLCKHSNKLVLVPLFCHSGCITQQGQDYIYREMPSHPLIVTEWAPTPVKEVAKEIASQCVIRTLGPHTLQTAREMPPYIMFRSVQLEAFMARLLCGDELALRLWGRKMTREDRTRCIDSFKTVSVSTSNFLRWGRQMNLIGCGTRGINDLSSVITIDGIHNYLVE